MKSTIRLTLLLALVALLVFAPTAFTARAQGEACLPGLSAEDCTLLQTAFANQAGVTSFVMDYTLTLNVAGVPEPVAVSVTGNGPIDISGVAGVTDQNAILNAITMANTISASFSQGSNNQQGNFEFRIVDGFLYFKGDMATQDQWMKVDLAKAAAQSGSSGMPLDPSAMNQLGALASPEVMGSLAAVVGAEGFITAEGSDGQEVDGVATRQITVNFDLAVLLEKLFSEDGTPLLQALASAQGQELTEAQLEQFRAQGQQILTMLGPTLENTTFSVSWLIGTEASQFRGFAINFVTKVDPQLGAMMGGGASTEEISVDFNFQVTLSKLGEPVTVEPVAEAVEAPMGN